MASPRFLLGCYEVPGWGGAATVAYALFRRMQGEGKAVQYVNLVNAADTALLAEAFGPRAGNPAGLDDVHTLVLPEPLWRVHDELSALIAAMKPDLMVARGFIAAWLMKRAAPRLPLAFLTSGSAQIKRLLREGAIDDFVDFALQVSRGAEFSVPPRDHEAGAVEDSELIVLHSPLVRFAFEHCFPSHLGKVYDRLISVADDVYRDAAPFTALARPFAARDIDVIFIASNWSRPEKNLPLLRRLATACGGRRVHVVGALDAVDLPVQRHGIVARREDVYALLGRAKVLVCPSRWDPAPGVLFEASAMGANVVASRNSGNWQLCNDALLADSPEAFATCIERALIAPLPDNRAQFLGGYADLVETLEAFV
ncbi:MAG: glycosyltransferase [bacterium]